MTESDGSLDPRLKLTIIAGVFVVVWEVIAYAEIVSPLLFASLVDILLDLVENWSDYSDALQVTLYSITISIVLAWGLGISLGVLVGYSTYLNDVFRRFFTNIFAIPYIVFYPVFVGWFGFGPRSNIVFAASYAFFPIVLNTMVGVSSVERRFFLVGRSIGASRLQLIFRILLPMAIPSILSGLRIGTALAVIGVIVTEMIASESGLGTMIRNNQAVFNIEGVYASILLALVVVALVNVLITRMENSLLAWKE